MTAATRRPVRVTLEGEAYRPVPGHDNVLMVVLPNDHKVCLTEGPGITVEDIMPPRTWTDGDIITVDGQTVWARHDGRWYWAAPGAPRNGLGDDAANRSLTNPDVPATVLRYQAGDA